LGDAASLPSSAIYLRCTDDELTLTVEHRAEPSHGPIPVQLAANGAALALTAEAAAASAASADPEPAATPAQRIAATLADLDGAVMLDQLRRAGRMRTQTLCNALAELVRAGRVLKSEAGHRLA
jgi:hypothetical protein